MSKGAGEAEGMELERAEGRRSGMTVEAAAWIVLAAVGLVLRLAALGAAPLTGAEAGQAMLAWRAATGQGMPVAGAYSPVLLWGNVLLFWLFGATDAAARLLPALLGGGLVVLPVLLRKQLGRVGALAAGCFLAISPSALRASRQVDGIVAVAVGGLLVVAGAARFLEKRERRWLFAGVVGAAISLTAGPWGGAALLIVTIAWAGWAWVRAEGELGIAWRALRPHLVVAGAVLALSILVLATGMLWNVDGLAAVGRMIVEWAGSMRGAAEQPAASPVIILLVYEPLALAFAAGALIVAIRKGDRFAYVLATWAVLATALVAASEGRQPTDVLIAVVPLALLAGRGVGYLARSLASEGRSVHEGLIALGIVVLLGVLYFVLVRYSGVSSPNDLAVYSGLLLILALLLPATAAVLLLVVPVISPSTAIRGAAIGFGLALLVYTVSAAWGVAYVRPDDPRELLVHRPTPANVRDLVDTVQGLSWRETGTEGSVPIATDVAPESVLAWYLKDFERTDWVTDIAAVTWEYGVLVSESTSLDAGQASLVGQDFALTTSWGPPDGWCTLSWPPSCGPAVKWLLVRDTAAAPRIEEVAVVWARREMVVIELAE